MPMLGGAPPWRATGAVRSDAARLGLPGFGVDWATGSGVDAGFRQILTGHTDWVVAVAVATAVVDGRPVAVTGSTDATVRMWDLTTGQQVGPELVFPEQVNAVAIHMGGRLVVGFDREVAVLNRC